MDSTPPRIIRVAPATVVVFSVILSPALFMSCLLIWRGQQLPEAIGLCLGYVTFVSVMCSPSVELSDNRLVYRAFLRRREISLTEVEEVRMSADPAPRITLLRKGDAGEPFSFLVKPFSKPGLVAILRHIQTYSREARFDEVSTAMTKGDFGPITRETTSSRNLIRIALTVGAATIGSALVRALMQK